MKYGILFLILGGIVILQAGMIGGVYWILVWPGLSFVVVAAAYLGLGPCVFGKRPDETMGWYAVALLLPYLLLTWLTWHVARLISSEECCNNVVPGLYVGRRPLANEVPDDVTLVVDLTSEFADGTTLLGIPDAGYRSSVRGRLQATGASRNGLAGGGLHSLRPRSRSNRSGCRCRADCQGTCGDGGGGSGGFDNGSTSPVPRQEPVGVS